MASVIHLDGDRVNFAALGGKVDSRDIVASTCHGAIRRRQISHVSSSQGVECNTPWEGAGLLQLELDLGSAGIDKPNLGKGRHEPQQALKQGRKENGQASLGIREDGTKNHKYESAVSQINLAMTCHHWARCTQQTVELDTAIDEPSWLGGCAKIETRITLWIILACADVN